jgi:hypothetical protein
MGYLEGFVVCVFAAVAAMWVNDKLPVGGDYIQDEQPSNTH